MSSSESDSISINKSSDTDKKLKSCDSKSTKNGKSEIQSDSTKPKSSQGKSVKQSDRQKGEKDGEKEEELPPRVETLDKVQFGDEYTDRRLWVGNLDTRLSEFAVLKIIQKYGEPRKMDFVYHRAGPDKGKSKGFCFISFHTWEAADEVRSSLDGKLVMGRPICVKWAKGMREEEFDVNSGPVVSSLPMGSSGIQNASNQVSADAKIRAIEAKLRLMQDTKIGVDHTIRPPPGWTPPVRPAGPSRGGRRAPYRRHTPMPHNLPGASAGQRGYHR